MPIHDISVPLRSDLPAWPGEEGMKRTLLTVQPDEPATVSHLAFSAHTGTHIDAPIHFITDGGGVETFDVGVFVGRCFVADLRHVGSAISGDDLEKADVPENTTRLLALTRNSGWSNRDTAFRSDFVAYDLSAASWCLNRRIRLLGSDYLSTESYEAEGHPVHKKLLGAGVALLEGLDLDGVDPGDYDLVALPILVPGSDGSPVRAVLIDHPARRALPEPVISTDSCGFP